ncbi:MAG: UDP-N-acetylmuramoyl-tripeptide--D-alanyl-D-alanine ligase [Sandaracinaceae bacterium]|nr:UDP-N-acetylmuramoyl-tripeptide--D-alanyl-D-alanine ligase [Sandaracinaceae bacterium]
MATPPPINAAPFTLEDLASITGARVIRMGSRPIRGVSTDTRTIVNDNLFVALRGERFDGHTFLARAIELGASALLVSDASAIDTLPAADVSIVIADDTLVALGALGRSHRERMEREGALRLVVAITGSVGKTTTKEMCAAVLEAMGHRTLRTAGNLNNRIGVPLTLLTLDPSHTAAVVEVGMNVPGEIAMLAAIARPHVGIVTSVAAVHTEGMKTIEAVAEEKASLLAGLAASPGRGQLSVAIYSVDDRVLVPHAQRSPAPLQLGVGRHEEADVRLFARRGLADGGSECRYAIRPPGGATSTSVELTLHLFGEGAARNAACALALAVAVGDTRALAVAAKALEGLRAGEGRGAMLAGLDGTLVIDDAYNASRRSVINALEAASELAKTRQGRVIAVLGDMLELGPYEEEEHLRVGEAVARVGASLFVACGRRMRIAAEEARELGADLVVEEDDPMAAIVHVRDFVRPDDVIVVKGSRSMGMERVVAALRQQPEARPDDERAKDEGGDV